MYRPYTAKGRTVHDGTQTARNHWPRFQDELSNSHPLTRSPSARIMIMDEAERVAALQDDELSDSHPLTRSPSARIMIMDEDERGSSPG